MARGKFKNTDIQAIYNRWIETMVSQLTEEGESVIKEAYRSSNDGTRTYGDNEYNPPTWKNVTGTLMESYGSAVYVQGKLRSDSIRYVGSFTAGGGLYNGETSQDYIDRYLTSLIVDSRNIITMVCVNAAPHAADLENGETTRGNEYIVISQMADEMEAINKRIVMPSQYRRGIVKIGDF